MKKYKVTMKWASKKKLYPYYTISPAYNPCTGNHWIEHKINYFFIKQISPCEKPVETKIFLN